jgi:hypothetical protein
MDWIATLPAILAAVTAIVTLVFTWQTAKINRDKLLVEYALMLKKASQDIAASSGTSRKPDYKEHAPPPKPSKVPKWVMFSFIASMLIFIGLVYYVTYTAPLTTFTIGFMFVCICFAIGNLILFIHRLIDNRINDESAWTRWLIWETGYIQLEMGNIDHHFTDKVTELQFEMAGAHDRFTAKLTKLQMDATAVVLRELHYLGKLQIDTMERALTGVKLQVHVIEQGFTEIKTLIQRR